MSIRKGIDIRNGAFCVYQRTRELGILNLDLQNRCLLSKWLFKLANDDGVHQTLLSRKYLRSKIVTQVEHIPVTLIFCLDSCMSVKKDCLRFGKFNLGDGSQIRFSEDASLGDVAFMHQYSSL